MGPIVGRSQWRELAEVAATAEQGLGLGEEVLREGNEVVIRHAGDVIDHREVEVILPAIGLALV